MKLLVVVLGLLFAAPIQAQEVRPAITNEAAGVLANAWVAAAKVGWPSQETFCAYGQETSQYAGGPVLVIASVVKATGPCDGRAIGIIGLINGQNFEMEQVNLQLGHALHIRKDLLMLGEVHGVERVFNGTWFLAPLMWAALRPHRVLCGDCKTS